MPQMRSYLRTRLAISAEKQAELDKIKRLFDQRRSRVVIQIGEERFNLNACTNVTFDPSSDADAIQFTRPTAQPTPAVHASATLDLTSDIVLTSVASGSARNTKTLTLQVLAAAANPTSTVLAAFTGTASAIVLTITPNDGTHNSATAVNLSTAQVRELIQTGVVVGRSVTVTDGSSLRALQTATGGGAANVADSGEGDGVVATFSGGADVIPPATEYYNLSDIVVIKRLRTKKFLIRLDAASDPLAD